jgi:hypothetical protein
MKVIFISARPWFALAAFALSTGAASAQYTFVKMKPPVAGAHFTVPLAISNNNQIAGTYNMHGGGRSRTYGFIRSNANPPAYTTLDDTFGAHTYTFAGGINSSGYVEGYYAETNKRVAGFEYALGNYSDFSLRGYRDTYGNGINDKGEAVGYAGGPHNEFVGFLEALNGVSIFAVTGATRTFPTGVNTLEEVVGWWDLGDAVYSHGFLREPNGQVTEIDFPGAMSTAMFGITDPSTPGGPAVASGTFTDTSFNAHGFLYSNGTFTQIDVPGATSTGVYGINVNGWITGRYTNSKGTFPFYAMPAASSTLIEE